MFNPPSKEPLRMADVFNEQTGCCWKTHRKDIARQPGRESEWQWKSCPSPDTGRSETPVSWAGVTLVLCLSPKQTFPQWDPATNKNLRGNIIFCLRAWSWTNSHSISWPVTGILGSWFPVSPLGEPRDRQWVSVSVPALDPLLNCAYYVTLRSIRPDPVWLLREYPGTSQQSLPMVLHRTSLGWDFSAFLFLRDYPGIMGVGEGYHRGKVPFHHVTSRIPAVNRASLSIWPWITWFSATPRPILNSLEVTTYSPCQSSSFMALFKFPHL